MKKLVLTLALLASTSAFAEIYRVKNGSHFSIYKMYKDNLNRSGAQIKINEEGGSDCARYTSLKCGFIDIVTSNGTQSDESEKSLKAAILQIQAAVKGDIQVVNNKCYKSVVDIVEGTEPSGTTVSSKNIPVVCP